MSAKEQQKNEEIVEETIIETVTPSDEELIMGAKEQSKIIKKVDYTSPQRRYNVENISKKRCYVLNGQAIGAIIGLNDTVREELKQGAKKVTITDRNGNIIYKIEVLKK